MTKYIILFIISTSGFLVYFAPANILKDYAPEFILSGKVIDGSAWHQKYGTISWQFNPSYLLNGNLAADITLMQKNTQITSTVMLSILGTPKLHNTSGVLELSYLTKFFEWLPEFVTADIIINSLDADILSTEQLLQNEISTEFIFADTVLMGEKIGTYDANLSLVKERLDLKIVSNTDSAFNIEVNGNNEENFINLKGNISGNSEIANSLLQSLNIANDINYRYNLENLQ